MIERLKMEKKAIEFRVQHGLTPLEPIRYYDLIKKLKVVSVFAPGSKKLSGMATKIGNMRFMYINSEMPLGKQNFTIAHEFYHLFIQENFKFKVCNAEAFDKDDKEEMNADLFASYLLLPNDGVLKLIPEPELKKDKIQLKTVLDIEQHYKCSRTALTVRLKELGLVSEEYRQTFLKEIMRNAIANDFPPLLYKETKPHFIGEDYEPMLEVLYEKGLIKESDYITQLQEIGINKI